MKRDLPTAEYVRSLLDYDAETGMLTWRKRPVELFRDTPGRTAAGACAIWNAKYASKEAGTVAGGTLGDGYIRVNIGGQPRLAHRLIWLIVTGGWPPADVDHVNRDRTDNRWVNLRKATRAQNLQNRRLGPHNASGFPGVCWHAQTGKWQAQIQVNSRQKFLGRYPTAEAANQARIKAEAELFPFSTRPEVLAFRASQALAFSLPDS